MRGLIFNPPDKSHLEADDIVKCLVIGLVIGMILILSKEKNVDVKSINQNEIWSSKLKQHALSNSVAVYHSDIDTVWYIDGMDTMFYDVYYHIGGAMGDPPDSVKRIPIPIF